MLSRRLCTQIGKRFSSSVACCPRQTRAFSTAHTILLARGQAKTKVETEQHSGQWTTTQNVRESQQTGMQTGHQVVGGDLGLQNHLMAISKWTAGGIGISAATASVSIMTGVFISPLVAFLGAFGCLIGTSFSKTEVFHRQGQLFNVDSQMRIGLAVGFFALQGFAIAPLLAASPGYAIAAAGCIAGGIISGMTAFALSKPQGALLKWGAPLSVMLFGMIGVSLLAMCFGGPFLAAHFWISTIGGLGLFSAFQAYDTQRAIQSYMDGSPDALGDALAMYLNFMNLFIRLLSLFRGSD
eukprot:TRINITY_DN94426_c0_g1_i1.p2 TRINITY_DN94426_c0_g1~~TRINITY_DN94426_c0_g1_i1.p2  ORF type:complete len:297 (-),score=37.72 TRINITY_DN94426_c0_g1_i1:1532-2422(-)